MSTPSRRLPFSGPPSRQPGQGDVDLEPVSGDIQLTGPKLTSLRRLVGRARATRRERERIYTPGERAPVSGVYDVVDEQGGYLRAQITCHEGVAFPYTNSAAARELDEPIERPDGTAKRYSHHFGYRLAYEALHLATPRPRDETIYEPGQVVPISGVYNVVGLDGEYLLHQRACVHDKGKRNPEVFPVTEELEPGTYGYRLEYEAEHLSSAR